MRELLGKIGRVCENHIEKIVFAIVVPVCAYLFFTGVIFSPNRVSFGNQSFTPGRIDAYVSERSSDLRAALASIERRTAESSPPSLFEGPIEPNNPVVASVFPMRPAPSSFEALFAEPLSFLDAGDMTVRVVRRERSDRKYALPPIGPVTGVAANHIRAAAYVPVEPITADRGYTQVATEPNDIDLVTVEARFDMREAYRQFRAYFAGTEVQKPEWRDPELGVPKPAAVELQRQERREDGTWGDWVTVPRSRVEQHRALLTPIEKVEDLPPGGMNVRLMQLDSRQMIMALLQPEGYQIASAEEDWLPPSFYSKFKDLQRKVELEQRRQEREERLAQQGAAAETTTGRGVGTRAAGARRNAAGGGVEAYGAGNRRGGAAGRTRTRGEAADDARGVVARGEDARGAALREEVSTAEAYLDYAEALITETTDLSRLEEPLLFWAFDDTAEPGHTYRYRVRLGMFNPVAGTGQVAERDLDKKDQVILWSRFSDVTDTVAIPRRLYFFAKDVQERAKSATVEVARYALGYWYSQDFNVRPGETIGREMEPPKKEEVTVRTTRADERITGGAVAGRPLALLGGGGREAQTVEPDDPTTPDMIDYSTDVMLVDLVETGDLGSPPNLRPRPYHDMLYTRDGNAIEHMPVSQGNWPAQLQQAYRQIAGERNKEHQPHRAFSASSRITGSAIGRGGR